jgi:hypothetical protein
MTDRNRKSPSDEPVRPAAAHSPVPEKPDPLAPKGSSRPRMRRAVPKDAVKPIPDSPDLV